MILTRILAALLWAPAPKAAPDARPPETQPAATRVGVLWIRATDLSYVPLADEIRLRLPEVELARYGDTRPHAPTGTLIVFVDVRAAPDREAALA